MFCVLFSCKVQWSHLASLKNNVSPVSRSHSFSDPSPKFAHHHLRSQDPCPPSRTEGLSQSSDSKSEVPEPTQKAWSRSDSDEVPPRVRTDRQTALFSLYLNLLFAMMVGTVTPPGLKGRKSQTTSHRGKPFPISAVTVSHRSVSFLSLSGFKTSLGKRYLREKC